MRISDWSSDVCSSDLTRAAAVVTIHDLTYLRYPEMCKRLVLQYPQLVGRALGRGAMVHTVSEFVRQEVIDHYGLAPERVVAVPNGITAPPPGDAAAGRRRAGDRKSTRLNSSH